MRPRGRAAAGLLDGRGCLTNEWRDAIHRHLRLHGVETLARECDVLVRAIGSRDRTAVWAMLMWNVPVTDDTVGKLHAWIDRGMPVEVPGKVPAAVAGGPGPPCGTRH